MARRGHSAVVGRRGGRKWTKVVVETCNTAGECTLERVERVVEENELQCVIRWKRSHTLGIGTIVSMRAQNERWDV
ncbi:MAG: hypothetical protein ACTS4Z_00675 [Candidatus Hodgkinia cicadicola]